RDTAGRLLYQRQDQAAVPALQQLAEKASTAQGRLHALYALLGLKKLDVKQVVQALRDPEPRVREHAVRLCEGRYGRFKVPPYRELWAMRRDDDPNVRIQLAYTLHWVGHPDITVQPQQIMDANEVNSAAVYVQLAVRDIGDPWMRLALLAGI